MTVHLRPATAADAKPIKDLIHEVSINPMGLDWERFFVAEEDGEFLGCIQIKPHKDGSRELASVAVTPARQSQGIGSLMVKAMLEREAGTLYLTCRKDNVTYYQRFGFVELEPSEYPRSFKVIMRAGQIFSKIMGSEGVAMMKRG
jgi:N-acetylglutamate synthase-like GNAT family acetyltransferase